MSHINATLLYDKRSAPANKKKSVTYQLVQNGAFKAFLLHDVIFTDDDLCVQYIVNLILQV